MVKKDVQDIQKLLINKKKSKMAKNRKRGPLTIYLNTKNFKTFAQLCKGKGFTGSKVLDKFIEQTLEKAGLPIDKEEF